MGNLFASIGLGDEKPHERDVEYCGFAGRRPYKRQNENPETPSIHNNCDLECEGSEDIASERSENRHLRRPPTTPLFDAPSLANPREYPHESYLARNQDPLAKFLLLTVNTSNFRTVLSESQKRQLISCRARNRC